MSIRVVQRRHIQRHTHRANTERLSHPAPGAVLSLDSDPDHPDAVVLHVDSGGNALATATRGTIVDTSGQCLMVRLDGRERPVRCHVTSTMEYETANEVGRRGARPRPVGHRPGRSRAVTALAPSRPVILTPTGDPAPVEKAVADGIAGDFEPETLLWINFHRPDGGVRIWYAWTASGQPLGDHVDQLAMTAGYDAADSTGTSTPPPGPHRDQGVSAAAGAHRRPVRPAQPGGTTRGRPPDPAEGRRDHRPAAAR